jgi:hypothetical protein
MSYYDVFMVSYQGRNYYARKVGPADPFLLEISVTRYNSTWVQHYESEVKRCRPEVTHSSAELEPVPMWKYDDLLARLEALEATLARMVALTRPLGD